MGTDSWKGHVNGILYGVQFDRVLDDTVVTRVADGVTAGLYPGGRAETREALDQALRFPGPLTDQADTHHSEVELRSFFRQLSAALSTPPSS
ncbi:MULTISPECIES: hypothetical protein [Micromonospora]|uniref:DUF5753 domain-containing protein n=1 Tax=Micromonospora vinacea TaxID=709878 RepID=A0ABS0K035_9ACTN|nr:hypothetical protein [Micromonospora vinacea]MBG6101975.1 hypothetical protein [Micromonospora vinacea]WSZ75216.1 hypothetical protein OH804_25320 [Micromonospora sp. NBC_00860]WTA68295.1 hypothetical protein OHB51_03735 [Micromonospora sp. NBC_00855]